MQTKEKKKVPVLRIANWNVRNSLTTIYDAHKTALKDEELPPSEGTETIFSLDFQHQQAHSAAA